jgi:hypothetical protein
MKIAERRRRDEARWASVKAAYLAECERMRLPEQTTLANEAGFTRERARQILCSTRAPEHAVAAAERLTARFALCKPKPTKTQQMKVQAEIARGVPAAQRAEISKVVETITEMTSAYGTRGRAAADMGMHAAMLSMICRGKKRVGPEVAARLAAWVERHQS